MTQPGCQQKMAGQPSYQPLEASSFFSDGRSARPLIAGTVARGHLHTDVKLYSGRKTRLQPIPEGQLKGRDENIDFVDEFPFAVDERLIRHGRDRYSIYCVVCHDALGTGHGKIVERGYTRPPSYHIPRLREAPVGRLFAVVSDGYGSMPSYAAQIPVEDRWAIVAYVRALQLSQHFPAADLTDEMRQQLAAAP
jgi:mono/diheme cytochrome c family protein